jgi:ribosomal protein S18 acetylase RimI-like enzyme
LRIEFIRALVPHEIRSLVRFDLKVFPEADWFELDDWRKYKSFWMLLNGRRAGCCAFGEHEDFRDDIGPDNIRHKGTLYIASTGILREFQGVGLGRLMKAWQVSYARYHRFRRIVTNCRKSNLAMISLNEAFGFGVIRTTPHYYENPDEPTVVMELTLAKCKR